MAPLSKHLQSLGEGFAFFRWHVIRWPSNGPCPSENMTGYRRWCVHVWEGRDR